MTESELRAVSTLPAASVIGRIGGHTDVIRGMISQYFQRISPGSAPSPAHRLKIGCVDSRLHLSLFFDQQQGGAYVLRNIANIVPGFMDGDPKDLPMASLEVLAALEYAVRYKGVSEIVVVGHTDCGGAEAHMAGGAPKLVQNWVEQVPIPADYGDHRSDFFAGIRNKPTAYELLRRGHEEMCLSSTVTNLKTIPFIQEAMNEGRLSLYSMIGDIHNAKLKIMFEGGATDATQDLSQNFEKFREEGWGENGTMPDLVENGQHPDALIITGMSPYLSPAKLFGIDPGEAFVYRNLGGRYAPTPGETDGLSAAIEFAVDVKGVKEVIYIGSLGDANADYALGKLDDYPYVRAFIERTTPGIEMMRQAGGSPEAIQLAGIRSTLETIKAHPSIVAAGSNVSVTGLVNDFEHGRLLCLDNDGKQGQFVAIVPEP